MRNNNPIIIIGPPRSGTTLLGSVFEAHPDVLFVGEPNFVWRYGNASSKTDLLTKKNYTNEIGKYIKQWFSKKLIQSKKEYLVEKTPANSMRIPFILSIYPNAKFIILTRNPIDTIESVVKEMNLTTHNKKQGIRKKNKSLLSVKLEKISQINWKEWIYYLEEFYGSLLQLLKIKNKNKVWGPKFPGIYDLQNCMGSTEIAALQWRWCMETILKDKNKIPNSNLYELTYEDLTQNPILKIQELFDFTGLTNYKIDDTLIHKKTEKKTSFLDEHDLKTIHYYTDKIRYKK